MNIKSISRVALKRGTTPTVTSSTISSIDPSVRASLKKNSNVVSCSSKRLFSNEQYRAQPMTFNNRAHKLLINEGHYETPSDTYSVYNDPQMPAESHYLRRRTKKIKKLMCANRGEIAIRVFRAATELGVKTVSIYTHEDRLHVHRYKADEAFLIGKNQNPVSAYLNIEEIVKVAKENDVDAIHPGYGFLSENPEFAKACEREGIIFIGPSVSILENLGEKTQAKQIAKECSVPVIPGSSGAVESFEKATEFAKEYGFPIMIKASSGGGGRGMRIVKSMQELKENYNSAKSEAKAVFGDERVFMERYLENPRHIEVQILGDAEGNIIHLFERDCSVQRRHQKVVEIAPAVNLDDKIRQKLIKDAITIANHVKYRNAGTVEFLVDKKGNHYFIEVNPRIQVEHVVSEEITGIDLVQSQIRIADGSSFKDLGISQADIKVNGFAVQVRVTTEDPEKNFQPDIGTIEVYRPGEGFGIRIDSSFSSAGAKISPHYDSLLSKVTVRSRNFLGAVMKLQRVLKEFRVRGVKTNIPFLQNVVSNPKFIAGELDTGFITSNPDLFKIPQTANRAQKLLYFFAENIVNGAIVSGVKSPIKESKVPPIVPELTHEEKQKKLTGWRDIYKKEGAEAFAKAVRNHKGVLLMDTTMRDAHQSLLATRVRTKDLLNIAPYTSHKMSNLYALENWGGATFDVSYRFLFESPWERLIKLRESVPHIPFQMLLRGANAVGYTAYPDNVVHKFCKESVKNGIDIFRIFDSLNYLENMKLGIDAVGNAGGIIEAAICYSGDVTDDNSKYNLEYYLKLVREYVKMGIHVLAIKDMAGLLTPASSKKLVSAIRREFNDLPIHVHTHDTAGVGVASMLACAEAGADVVDVAVDALSGLTSQPALGAVVASLNQNPEFHTGVDLRDIQPINDYWEQTRLNYSSFESGQKSAGADVFLHEMPGGQYTNLMFQAKSLGLAAEWPKIKKAYTEANKLLGDVVKVTPSSKVVGDLAQFMVANKLSARDVELQAKSLNFPQSVVEFFQGYLGIPHGGFPEPLRTNILRGAHTVEGRPGASLDPFNFVELKSTLEERHSVIINERDLLSSALYPKVYDDYMNFRKQFGDISVIDTKDVLNPLTRGEEISVEIEKGKVLMVKFKALGELDEDGLREVFFELNGLSRSVKVLDKSSTVQIKLREKVDKSNKFQIGAPMPGSVIEMKVKEGDLVEKDSPILVLSAMKMETVIKSSVTGIVQKVHVAVGDTIQGDDLLIELRGK